jgi:predicted outer membrane repeat protein
MENTANNDGGGILNEGTLTLTRVTFQNNTPNDCVDVFGGTGCP